MDIHTCGIDHQEKVLLSYQQQNFSTCLDLVEQTPMFIQNTAHYKVLKATCLVNLGRNFGSAHALFDEVLTEEANNPFAYYGKGLAFFHQRKYTQAISCFDSAIEFDDANTMDTAKELKFKSGILLRETGESDEESSDGLIVNDAAVEVNVKKPKSCNICSKSFTKTYSLTRHMLIHTGEKPFKCPHCSSAFSQRYEWNRHIARHETSFRHDCAHCLNKFKTKEDLQSHQATHADLQSHQATHTSDRPFPCRFCSKSFRLNKLLRFHESLHNQAKPFLCDLCPKTFPAKRDIKAHIETHIGAQPFGCNLCRISYATLERLGRHFREHHGVGMGVA